MLKRRSFLALAAGSALPSAWTSSGGPDSVRLDARHAGIFGDHEFTLAELQRAMERGALTAASLVRSYLERIDAIDRGGAALNAIVESNPDALDVARALDDERRQRGARGPLH